MSVAGVDVHHHISVDQLQPGDHIYVHTVCYAFTHHAIYDGNGYVIHRPCGATVKSSGEVHVPDANKVDNVLTSLRIQGTSAARSPKHTESLATTTTSTSSSAAQPTDLQMTDEPQPNGNDGVASTESDAVSASEPDPSTLVGSGCVRRVKIEEFAGPHDLRLYRYERSVAQTAVAPTGTCSEYPRNTNRTAVSLARWFVRQPAVFNEYDKSSWHCEHFATFCCTTWLSVADMEEALDNDKLTRLFLTESSNAFGTQTESTLSHLRVASRVLVSPVMLALDAVGSKLLPGKAEKEA